MAKEEGKPLSGREVLNRMAAAYHKASSYADAGTVHLVAEAGDKKIDEVAQFSVSLVRPNKLRLQAYDAILVCDGQKTYAAVKDVPDQVLVKPAPERLTLKSIDVDLILRKVVSEGFASAPPQPLFLLADDPLAELLRGAEEPQLSEPGEIEGRACYRVRFKDAYGEATFWVDQQTYVLRRLVLPTDQLRQGLSQDNPVERLSLVADFSGARIDDKVDPKAFEFQVAAGVKVVKFLVPPELSDLLHTAELLGKPAPDLKFSDVDGKPVTLESMAGKNVVLDFWATDCLPCRESLPKLEKVREQFKDNSKVAFFAVSVDGPEVPTKKLVAYFEESRVRLPLLRDTAQSAQRASGSAAFPPGFSSTAREYCKILKRATIRNSRRLCQRKSKTYWLARTSTNNRGNGISTRWTSCGSMRSGQTRRRLRAKARVAPRKRKPFPFPSPRRRHGASRQPSSSRRSGNARN